MFYTFKYYWIRIFSILFSCKKKVFVLCHPTHPNLGDQAQLLCTDNWIRDNYPDYQIIHLGFFRPTINFENSIFSLINEFSFRITYWVLKLKMSRKDILLGHSGYFMVDHHLGWKMFTDMMRYFPNNKMIIFPQTINFHTPVIRQFVSESFKKNSNVVLLCRDEVSYQKGKELFPSTPLLLYPDIVTSLIGTKHFNHSREGILFCMRDDIEAFYKPEQITNLINRFGPIRKDLIDTTLKGLTTKDLDKNRETIIADMISKIATYKVVITDRYHGTIFSAIASTPVVVINSSDHKLSSGVKWFPKDVFGNMVQYAENLDEAYDKAINLLNQTDKDYNNPPYFKNNYWDTLKSKL